MSDRDALLQAFERGELLRPSTEHTGFVDIVRAVMHSAGAPLELSEHSKDIATHLHGVEHIVFLLADGLGIEIVDRMPRRSWIREHTRRAIHAPFPTTTTTAVTSIATAEYPAQHAVGGWWIHLPEIEGPATVFAHDRAVDGRSLREIGIGVETVSPARRVFGRLTSDAMLLVPAGIADSAYTEHMADGCRRVGYRNYREAIETILQHVEDATGPTFTYWYTASPDSEAHDEGSRGVHVGRSLGLLDTALESLASGLSDRTRSWRIVGTADHGHLDIEPHLELDERDPLLDLLKWPVAGDMRVQYWHVRDGAHEAFERSFRERFGDHFFLLTAPEVEALELFGPGRWSAAMQQRCGDYVSIARGAAALRYAGIPGRAGYQRMRSGHSGLTPAEMLIPLILGGEDVEIGYGS
ncbi:MAG: alkaline phosphatase family protein [Chloroflexi bacterium]|nr:alkaline phosphatase family protein [Chloroflexota bacterium]